MRLWLLIVLCFLSFLPVPMAVWWGALEKPTGACAASICDIRLQG